ncbi:MAG: ribosome assembly factor SBDS [Nitrososphaeria archaeon]
MSGKLTIARLEVKGEVFEVLVHPDKALRYKMEGRPGVEEVIALDVIFTDASKGERASEERLRKAFGTTDHLRVAKEILDRGEIQITAEQRRQLIEDKRKQIIAYISKNFVDPRTNLPHPAVRVEQALKEVRVQVDPFRPAEEQVKKIIDELRAVLPLKTGTVRLQVTVPAQYASRVYGLLKSYGELKEEKWLEDGGLRAVVELPLASQGAFIDRISSATKGSAAITPLEGRRWTT